MTMLHVSLETKENGKFDPYNLKQLHLIDLFLNKQNKTFEERFAYVIILESYYMQLFRKMPRCYSYDPQ